MELPEGDAVTRLVLSSNELWDEGDLKAMEDELRKYLALDRPRHIRYLTWIGNLLKGDLGRSIGSHIGTQKAVKDLVGDRIGLTVALTGFTILVTWSFAIPVGIYSAVRQHSITDYTFTIMGFTG